MKPILLAILLISPLSHAVEDKIRTWSQCAAFADALNLDVEVWKNKIKDAQKNMTREEALTASWRQGYQWGYYYSKGFSDTIRAQRARQYKKKCKSL